jgi:hypothetical protein
VGSEAQTADMSQIQLFAYIQEAFEHTQVPNPVPDAQRPSSKMYLPLQAEFVECK